MDTYNFLGNIPVQGFWKLVFIRNMVYIDHGWGVCLVVYLCVQIHSPTLMHASGSTLGYGKGCPAVLPYITGWFRDQCTAFVAMSTYTPNARCQWVLLYSWYGWSTTLTNHQAENITYSPAGISKISNFDNWWSAEIKQCVATVFLTISSFCNTNPSLIIRFQWHIQLNYCSKHPEFLLVVLQNVDILHS